MGQGSDKIKKTTPKNHPPHVAAIALITGASKGIGKAFAEIFAREGYSLILVARNHQALMTLQAELKEKYKTASKIIATDLSIDKNIDTLMQEIENDLPNINILINNAGYGIASSFADTEHQEMTGMIDLNITALTRLTHHILPHMLARKTGKIMNVASIAAFMPGPDYAVYYATKAYVLSFSLALYEECQQHGITISALCPGPTITDFIQRSGSDKTLIHSKYMSPETPESVAEAGFRGLMKGKAQIIPGVRNKIRVFLGWLTPNFLLLKVVAMINKRRG